MGPELNDVNMIHILWSVNVERKCNIVLLAYSFCHYPINFMFTWYSVHIIVTYCCCVFGSFHIIFVCLRTPCFPLFPSEQCLQDMYTYPQQNETVYWARPRLLTWLDRQDHGQKVVQVHSVLWQFVGTETTQLLISSSLFAFTFRLMSRPWVICVAQVSEPSYIDSL